MKSLELKIPPPIIVAMLAIAMWGISKVTSLILMSTSYHVYMAIALALWGEYSLSLESSPSAKPKQQLTPRSRN
jgi:hypothetical protein